MTAVELRVAVSDDALCLSVLAMQVFLDTYAREGIRPAIAREVLGTYAIEAFSAAIADTARTRITVAERKGHLIGFAQVTLGATQALVTERDAAELLRLYVQEPFTGSGVGTRLLAAAEQQAQRQGASVLWLTPWVHNHRAIAFYARWGYVDRGQSWFRLEDESHENRVLTKGLAAAG